MNDAWKRILKKWIESHDAINTLNINAIMDEDLTLSYKSKLLEDIIDTFKEEVEE